MKINDARNKVAKSKFGTLSFGAAFFVGPAGNLYIKTDSSCVPLKQYNALCLTSNTRVHLDNDDEVILANVEITIKD